MSSQITNTEAPTRLNTRLRLFFFMTLIRFRVFGPVTGRRLVLKENLPDNLRQEGWRYRAFLKLVPRNQTAGDVALSDFLHQFPGIGE
jgi:hypothetical protein